MQRKEAIAQFNTAQKLGLKCKKNDILHGRYPYLQVLDELIDESMIAGQVDLGQMEVPAERIVGTKSPGRKTAFASNFMPLLDEESEFGMKWIMLCSAHLSDEGIRDAVQCYEYLGRFYVQEGNKRVSVLRSYEASTIPCHVTRIIPTYSEDPQIKAYYEFMRYYQLSGLYQTSFTRQGSSVKFQAALGFEPGHVWTKEEQSTFISRYTRFREFYNKQGGDRLETTVADAMLVWLRVYQYEDLKTMVASELAKTMASVWPDIQLLSKPEPVEISTTPLEDKGKEEKGILSMLLGTKPSRLKVAFLFQNSSEHNPFTQSHLEGVRYVEEHMGDRVEVACYYDVTIDEKGEWIMTKAVAEGADVLIATVPPMIGMCRKIAARNPKVKILNCALSVAYSGVRTYYGRIYEAKFITGAIAAAMAREDTLGYVANYPIYGVPASVNAFAMGARMINPKARIQLEWTCTEGNPYEKFDFEKVRVITNRDVPSPRDAQWPWDWGTYRIEEDQMLSLASPCWNWGIFYQKVLTSILNGSWDSVKSGDKMQAVSYWWGMDSGVIDVQINPKLPEGIKTLAKFLKDGIINHQIDPFGFTMVDQEGKTRTDGIMPLTPEEIVHMDYLCDCVDGTIPQWEELLPRSQNLVRVLGLYRDQIPPEKEGVLL